MKDVDRLQDAVRHRGLSVLLVDLPKLGKAYDRGLSDGIFDTTSIPRGLGSPKGGFIFETLLMETFPNLKDLVDPGPEIVRITRTFFLMFKKAVYPCPDNVVRRHHHEFFELDSELRVPTRNWGSLDFPCDDKLRFIDSSEDLCKSMGLTSEASLHMLHLLDAVCAAICPSDEVYTDDLIGKHGPGRVSDAPANGDKYSFPNWSMRLGLYFAAPRMITHWGEAESEVPDYWGTVNGQLVTKQFSDEPDWHLGDVPAKLIAVPKTYDKPRLIASEPTSNQFCQQSLMQWLRENLTPLAKEVIDFRSQEPSRRMALEGSLTGDLVTVDLSSASDRLSCWAVERALSWNESLLIALNACRTPTVTSELVGRSCVLRKFAAQGSAVTFPVQSLIYSAAAIAATLWADGYGRIGARTRLLPRDIIAEVKGRVRVFGDDIIVPKSALVYLHFLLTFMGLKINGGKTHHCGNFRESCGMDAWKGVEVTPVYVPSTTVGSDNLLEVVSWVCVSNNAYGAGYRHLRTEMEMRVPSKLRKYIPSSSKKQPGLAFRKPESPWGTEIFGKIRWNKELHRFETKMLCVQSRDRLQEREGWANLLQYFTEGRMGRSYDLSILEVLERGNLGFVDQRRVTVVARWVAFN
jgi:hypothetical protein